MTPTQAIKVKLKFYPFLFFLMLSFSNMNACAIATDARLKKAIFLFLGNDDSLLDFLNHTSTETNIFSCWLPIFHLKKKRKINILSLVIGSAFSSFSNNAPHSLPSLSKPFKTHSTAEDLAMMHFQTATAETNTIDKWIKDMFIILWSNCALYIGSFIVPMTKRKTTSSHCSGQEIKLI